MVGLRKRRSGMSTDYSPLYGKVLVGDGDILAYRSAAIAEKKFYLVQAPNCYCEFSNAKEAKEFSKQFDNSKTWNRVEDFGANFAIEALRASLDTIVEKTKPIGIEIYLSGDNNHRERISKTYKASRKYLPRPKYLEACKEYLISEYGAKRAVVGEADDELGIRSTELGDSSFICTIDKDLNQVEGWKYNWVDDRVYFLTPKEASFAFYSQVLSGDRVDDVAGIQGIGPVGASSILEGGTSVRDIFRRVWDVYCRRSGKAIIYEAWDYLLEQCHLLYILRERDKFYEPPFIPDEVQNYYGVAETDKEFNPPAAEGSGDTRVVFDTSLEARDEVYRRLGGE